MPRAGLRRRPAAARHPDPGPRRNVELKCRCGDLRAARRRARALGARDAGVLRQVDTFFAAGRARLKLRELGGGRAELISYRRPDIAEARGSQYRVVPVASPAELSAVLAYALEVAGVVRKKRHLLLWRHTRIHLDEVDGLGTFVELETVVDGQSDEEALAELREAAKALGLRPRDRLALPYVELLRGRGPGGARAGSGRSRSKAGARRPRRGGPAGR